MKTTHFLPATVAILATVLSGNLHAQTWENISGGTQTYTSGSVGVGTASTVTTPPTDAWMHIYGQASWVPGTAALGGGPCTTLGYPNPELWIDRQVDYTYASTCWPVNPTANYFQVSNSGPSFSGYVQNIIDVINSQGFLGILNPNPAEALDVNGSGIIKQKLYVKGDLIDMQDAADHNRVIRAQTDKSALTLNANTTSADGGAIELYGPHAPGRSGNVHFIAGGEQGGGFNFYNYTGGTYHRQMNIANGSGLVTIDNNLNVVGGQVSMPMTWDGWRLLDGASNTAGLKIESGGGGGSYVQYCAENFTDKGAIEIVCNNGGTGTTFWSFDAGGNWSGLMRLQPSADGQVIIGKNLIGSGGYAYVPTDYDLIVEKGILAEKVKVALRGTSDWSDYVFDANYKLNTLEQVEAYVNENKHLPDIPSACEVQEQGIDVAKMDAKLLQKIEELTLYTIQLKKEIDDLKKDVRK